MYSEVKGFTVGRAISGAEERSKRRVERSSAIQEAAGCEGNGCTREEGTIGVRVRPPPSSTEAPPPVAVVAVNALR